MTITGGCLCQAVRYRISADAIDAGYCHCRLCQRSAGAPVLAWGTFPRAALEYTRGAPGVYASSEQGQREYCAGCGTQPVFRHAREPETLDVTLASLDERSTIQPQYHIWVASKVDWLQITDNLPQYQGDGPDHPNAR